MHPRTFRTRRQLESRRTSLSRWRAVDSLRRAIVDARCRRNRYCWTAVRTASSRTRRTSRPATDSWGFRLTVVKSAHASTGKRSEPIANTGRYALSSRGNVIHLGRSRTKCRLVGPADSPPGPQLSSAIVAVKAAGNEKELRSAMAIVAVWFWASNVTAVGIVVPGPTVRTSLPLVAIERLAPRRTP